ncbi:archease [Halorubrum trueperi]|uniref:Archease n=1 Tax=Halorubrum trueperi TaxID=2004704 RepID=A0ABD5UQV7_9EURY
MTHRLRDHTADVAVEATAPTLSGLFESVAEGLTAASCESVPERGERFGVTVRAERPEALLFDYLDQLIYERDVRLVLPADHRCAVSGPAAHGGDETGGGADEECDLSVGTGEEAGDGSDEGERSEQGEDDAWTVSASARGVPLADVAAREIKAVTYSDMALERRDDGWYAYVVFDV